MFKLQGSEWKEERRGRGDREEERCETADAAKEVIIRRHFVAFDSRGLFVLSVKTIKVRHLQ